jgi:GGDEF domain-containing protein
MASPTQNPLAMDDPRRLREILDRAVDLAERHSLTSVLVGIAGQEGDSLFPEIVAYVESGLRMDDKVFRMTRERAVLLLTDVDAEKAELIVRRLLTEFCQRFPTAREPEVFVSSFAVEPGALALTLKQVLPRLFPAPGDPN